MSTKAVRLLFALGLCFAGIAASAQTAALPAARTAVDSQRLAANYGKLPLSFEPNLGQSAKQVQWLSRGPEYTLFLAGNEAVLEMNKITAAKRGGTSREELSPSIRSSVVRMSLLGARTAQQTTGEDPQSGKANYFTGNDPARWQHDVPMYGKVRIEGVYPGVDLVYYGHQGALEYDFVVAPGADASAIRLRFEGAQAALASNGDLRLPVNGSSDEVRFNKPVVYQRKDGVRQPVEGSFLIAKDGQVSFRLGAYDHGRELVIDPTLTFVGILGTGNNIAEANGMAVDAAGEIILTGLTGDVDFPVTAGAYQTVCNTYSAVAAANNYVRCGGAYIGSAFVTKISADGTSLVYSTYLHGFSGSEYGKAVAVDSSGDAIVLGETGSSDFPITADAYQSLCMPWYQMKGVVGGSPSDFYPIAESCDGYFAGGGTEWVSGGPTLFIAKLDPTGSALLYSTFFGGTLANYPFALALDSSDNIYFTGFLQGAEQYLQNGVPFNNWYPQSSTVPFPTTASAFQIANLAQQATTFSVLSADGHTLLYSTMFGATNTANPGFIQALALAVGPNGIAYLGGMTNSDGVPTTAGSVRPACVDSSVYNGGTEYGNCEGQTGWLAAFDTTKSGAASLKYGTYIGGPETPTGNPQNQVLGLAADSANNIYVTGMTTSQSYPTTAGVVDTVCTNYRSGTGNCNNTGFLTKINPAGSAYVWSTYYGGNNDSQSQGQAIAFDAKGHVYLYGYDSNYTYDIPLVNPVEPRPGNGSSYAFVATLSADGTQLLFSSPLGNQSPSAANVYPVGNNGIALDAAGNIYFAAYGGDCGTFIPTSGTYATTAIGCWPRTYFGKISPVLELDNTVLTVTPATATLGQNVTFKATVTGVSQTTPTPTGSVSFQSGTTILGSGTLNASGVATATSSSAAVGINSVVAVYSGDSIYDANTSAAVTLTVNPGPQTITFVTPATQVYGATLGLSATASSGLAVSFASTTGAVCTVAGTTASFVGAGTCTIQATQAGDSDYLAAPAVSRSFTVARTTQTITFPAIPATTLVTGSVAMTATASSGLAVSYASATPAVCTVSGSTVNLVAGGNCGIVASQAGNSDYYAAAAVGRNFAVTLAAQTITFPAIATQTYGTPVSLSATASSGLAVTFASLTSPVCTVSGTTATLVASGTCTIKATQTGSVDYAAATPVSQSFTVMHGTQTITFPAIPATTLVTGSVALGGTASSSLPVSYASATPTICTVTGSTVSLVAVGNCGIVASQAGNSDYYAAAAVGQNFHVTLATQVITFPVIATQTFGTPVALSATASSGLAVSFASTTATVCTVSGTTATLLASGTCTIKATQAGNVDYAAAAAVAQSFTVMHEAQTITFAAIPATTLVTGSVALTATASSGLPVSFASATPTICTVSGSTVHLVAAGNCGIVASQAGNSDFAAATAVGRNFAVTLATQTITFPAISATPLGTGTVALTATASSGLAVSYTSATPTICTVAGSTVTLVATGNCGIVAHQAGNFEYYAAPAVGRNFTVTAH
jgi:hypothetical protein